VTLRTRPAINSVEWIPALGRPELCRRGGCQEPAVNDTLRLCAGHARAYVAELPRATLTARELAGALRVTAALIPSPEPDTGSSFN